MLLGLFLFWQLLRAVAQPPLQAAFFLNKDRFSFVNWSLREDPLPFG